MTQALFIGVDGGATKCMVRVEDEAGHLLGKEVSGPASIRVSVEQAWQSILKALNHILRPHAIDLNKKHIRIYAGMGLAGCEITTAYQQFLSHHHPFDQLMVTSDAHTACLGAHSGKDGAIIIAGTGVVGYQIESDVTTKIGGWGFPFDDEGGGAWMGLEAVKLTVQWLDARIRASSLTQAVYAHFQKDSARLMQWANQANSTAFAELAPIVIQQSEAGEVDAISILKRAAKAIDTIGNTLIAKQQTPLPLSLIGGVTTYIEPYLSATLRSRLYPCEATPDAGAVMLIRRHLRTSHERN